MKTNGTPNETQNFVAYYRVSTDEQNLGIDAQRATVENYVKTHGGEIIAEYEEKESGKNDNRAELQKAIFLCKRTGSTLLIAKLDRLSRNVEFLAHLKNGGNFNFLAVDVPYFDTLNFYMSATMAQKERELISERTKNALAVIKKNGGKLGANNGKSHKYTDEDREVAHQARKEAADQNPNNRKAWHYIKIRFDQGAKLVEIANELNAEQYQTPTGRGVWNGNQVKRIIKRYVA